MADMERYLQLARDARERAELAGPLDRQTWIEAAEKWEQAAQCIRPPDLGLKVRPQGGS